MDSSLFCDHNNSYNPINLCMNLNSSRTPSPLHPFFFPLIDLINSLSLHEISPLSRYSNHISGAIFRMWNFCRADILMPTHWRNDWSSQLYIQLNRSCEIKAWKKSGLNGILTHDLCDTDEVLYQLSYQLFLPNSNIWPFMYWLIFSSIYGYITNSQSDQPPVGLIVQSVELASVSQRT